MREPRFKHGTQQLMVRLPMEQYLALRVIQDTDGAPIAEQIRRGVQLWLDSKEPKKRSVTR